MSEKKDTSVTRISSVAESGKPANLNRIASGVFFIALAASQMLPEKADAAPNARPPFPSIQLSERTRGERALQALGNKLPEVAAHYRMTREKLIEILQKDQNAWVDKRGRLLFIDDFPPLEDAAELVSPSGVATAGAPYPDADTFRLHSRPGSQRVIYLDFNGHTTTGNAWRSGTIQAEPFDLDYNPSSFSAAELERIQYIWQRVAEDYAPFDVDVTTEEPSADALNRTSSSDQFYGTRVVITRSNIGVCSSCGGVAYVGVFDYYSSANPAYFQPAWVLFDALGAGNEKYVAEAISHEAGHTLGLSHDGTSTVGYYQGQGGWAPIMGVGYYQDLVQWSKGEYSGANNPEDDILVIQSNGANLRTDDVGSTMAAAMALAGTASGGSVTVNQGGLIERASDTDYFSFASGSGPLQITVTPDARSPNLDASIALYDADGNLLAAGNPVDSLSATINVSVPAGAYYLKVDGVGKAEPTSSGYSDYGSLGHYTLGGNYTASNDTAPVAQASATPTSGYAPLVVGFSSNGSSDSDGVIAGYHWDFGDGTSSTEPNPMHTYNTAGTFYPVLTVTDSQGLKDSRALTVSVAQNPLMTTLHIQNIDLAVQIVSRRYYQCSAAVTVNNFAGSPMSGVQVRGNWSGVTSKTVSATTSASGVAVFTSTKTNARGTCTFTASSLTLTGYTYDPSQNLETSDSLTY